MTGARLSEHRRRYRLGAGIAVTFRFDPRQVRRGEASTGEIVCEWTPAVPRMRPGNARNKLARRFAAARDDFLQDIAQLTGGRILLAEVDEQGRLGEPTVFQPQVPS